MNLLPQHVMNNDNQLENELHLRYPEIFKWMYNTYHQMIEYFDVMYVKHGGMTTYTQKI